MFSCHINKQIDKQKIMKYGQVKMSAGLKQKSVEIIRKKNLVVLEDKSQNTIRT
jgi:hypothetical protein